MGCNKAELLYEGKTFTELLIQKARQLGIKKIYISGYQGEMETLPDPVSPRGKKVH